MPKTISQANPRCSEESVRVLSVSPAAEDHIALGQLLSGSVWKIDTAENCDAAMRQLREGCIGVIICERDLPDGTWRNLLNYIQSCPDKPFLIVTSIVADDQLWAEVLNLGGYDVIAKPFESRDTTHVFETAYLHRIGVMPSRRVASASVA